MLINDSRNYKYRFTILQKLLLSPKNIKLLIDFILSNFTHELQHNFFPLIRR